MTKRNRNAGKSYLLAVPAIQGDILEFYTFTLILNEFS